MKKLLRLVDLVLGQKTCFFHSEYCSSLSTGRFQVPGAWTHIEVSSRVNIALPREKDLDMGEAL
jgi:hypothetical protein